MNSIKTFDQFNEEINWKNIATGAALATGLSLGSPQKAYTQPIGTELSSESLSVKWKQSEIKVIDQNGVEDIIDQDVSVHVEFRKEGDISSLKYIQIEGGDYSDFLMMIEPIRISKNKVVFATDQGYEMSVYTDRHDKLVIVLHRDVLDIYYTPIIEKRI